MSGTLAETLLPNTAKLAQRGASGSLLDFAAGFGIAAVNDVSGLLSLLPLVDISQIDISDDQLLGASAFKIGSSVIPVAKLAKLGNVTRFVDADVLVVAFRGNQRLLDFLRSGKNLVTPNQLREFLGGGAGRRAFLQNLGVQVFGGPEDSARTRPRRCCAGCFR